MQKLVLIFALHGLMFEHIWMSLINKQSIQWPSKNTVKNHNMKPIRLNQNDEQER